MYNGAHWSHYWYQKWLGYITMAHTSLWCVQWSSLKPLLVPEVTGLYYNGTPLVPEVTGLYYSGIPLVPEVTGLYYSGIPLVPEVTGLYYNGTPLVPEVTALYYNGTPLLPEVTGLYYNGTQQPLMWMTSRHTARQLSLHEDVVIHLTNQTGKTRVWWHPSWDHTE